MIGPPDEDDEKDGDEPWLELINGHGGDMWLQERNITRVSTSMLDLMKNARVLDLRKNLISKLPDGIASLLQLEELMLENNRLHRLPPSIGSLPKLKGLLLNRNCLVQLPAALCNLETLEVLNVADNKLKELPRDLGNLRNLVAIFVHNNHFTALPTSFSKLSKLKELSLEWFRYSAPPLPRSLRGDEWKAVLDKIRNLCHNRLPAVEVPCLEVIAYISERVFDINGVDSKRRCRLHVACVEGHTGIVKALTEAPNIRLNTLDVDGYSPLLVAVREEYTELCTFLVSAKADVNSGGGPFGTSIHVAVVNFSTQAVDLLIEGMCDVNFTDVEGNTPFHVLQSVFDKGGRRSQYIGAQLLKFKADCNILNADKWAPIHLAARRGQSEGIRFICHNMLTAERKAAGDTHLFDINIAGGSHQWTALHLAGHACHSCVVLSLVLAKADAERHNKEGKAPRYVSRGNLTVSKILKKAEMAATWERLYPDSHVKSCSSTATAAPASPQSTFAALPHSVRDLIRRRDPAAFLREFVQFIETGALTSAQYLLSFPQVLTTLADSSLKDEKGYCAMMYACAYGDEQLVRTLAAAMSEEQLAQLGTLTTPDERWTLIHLICQSRMEKQLDSRSAVTSFMLSVCQGRGFSLNATDYRGQTPLHMAVQAADLSLVQVLLQYHADANVKEATAGWSALHFAISPSGVGESRCSIALQLLHHAETNVNICDNFGLTPLFEACSQADPRTVSLLINAKADLRFVADANSSTVGHSVFDAIATSRKDDATKLWMFALLAANGYDFSTTELRLAEEDRQMLDRETSFSKRENPSRGIEAPIRFFVPFHLAPRCNACKILFSGPIRKFPCRSCGLVFCSTCSKVVATQVCCLDQVVSGSVGKLHSALARVIPEDSEPVPEDERSNTDSGFFSQSAPERGIVGKPESIPVEQLNDITPKPLRRPSSARNLRLCPTCAEFYPYAIGDTYDMLERTYGKAMDHFRKAR